jgi:hypothetical protein
MIGDYVYYYGLKDSEYGLRGPCETADKAELEAMKYYDVGDCVEITEYRIESWDALIFWRNISEPIVDAIRNAGFDLAQSDEKDNELALKMIPIVAAWVQSQGIGDAEGYPDYRETVKTFVVGGNT